MCICAYFWIYHHDPLLRKESHLLNVETRLCRLQIPGAQNSALHVAGTGSVKCARKWSKSATRGLHWVLSNDPLALTGAGEGAQLPSQMEVCPGEDGELATLGQGTTGQNGAVEGGAVP